MMYNIVHIIYIYMEARMHQTKTYPMYMFATFPLGLAPQKRPPQVIKAWEK